MKITEVEGFPKSLLKKKTIPLYKAFYIETDDEEMKVSTSADLFAISEKAAFEAFINENDNYKKYMQSWLSEKMDISKPVEDCSLTISFAIFEMDTKDLKEKDLLDEGEVFFQNDLISVTLTDKLYKVNVIDKTIIKFGAEYKDGRWKVTEFEMEDVKK